LFSKNTDWVALFPVIIIELHDWLMPGEGRSNNFLRTIAQHDRDFWHHSRRRGSKRVTAKVESGHTGVKFFTCGSQPKPGIGHNI
jgi:hypothetical protein